jgi:Gluconate 2-dehydrogenase subunit 3
VNDNDDRRPNEADSEVTRREWLVRLGEGGALIALRGVDLASAQTAANTAALPAGVWLPSYDHIGHALANRDPFVAMPAGCEVEYRQPPPEPLQPRFFSAGDFQTIRRLTGLILAEPADAPVVAEIAEWIDLRVFEAPGVREAARSLAAEYRAVAAHYHGEAELQELEETDLQTLCREGLAWLTAESNRRFQKSFLEVDETGQLAIVTAVLGDANERGVTTPGAISTGSGSRFLAWLKAMAIDGFYTSRAGLDELDYKGNSFYTSPPGCDTFRPK